VNLNNYSDLVGDFLELGYNDVTLVTPTNETAWVDKSAAAQESIEVGSRAPNACLNMRIGSTEEYGFPVIHARKVVLLLPCREAERF
jgi:hypothetical protein